MTAIDRNLLSRLDHAAYLGRELASAEGGLAPGDHYVQDAALGAENVEIAAAPGATPVTIVLPTNASVNGRA
jgi:tetrahydromethanopterin S-methyltransferase subunit A